MVHPDVIQLRRALLSQSRQEFADQVAVTLGRLEMPQLKKFKGIRLAKDRENSSGMCKSIFGLL